MISRIGNKSSIHGWLAALLMVLLPFSSSFAVENPIVDYRFSGDLTDIAGGSSILVHPACPADPCNSLTEFGTDAAGSYWRWESTNPRGGGFTLTTTEELGETYTVGLRFRFDSVGLDSGSSWRKIIDYRNRASDTGFYFYQGRIQFYNLGTSTETFGAGELLDLLAVRDGETDTFTVYIIEEDDTLTQVLQVNDTGGQSIPFESGGGSLLGFFFDDTATSAEATPGGQVYSVKIWDRALSEDDLGGALDDFFTVSTQIGPGGSIDPASQTVLAGEPTSFTITPDAGFEIASATGCGGELTGNIFTIPDVTEDCTVEVLFDELPDGTPEPAPVAVPMLNAWMLWLMGLLLAGLAVFRIRHS